MSVTLWNAIKGPGDFPFTWYRRPLLVPRGYMSERRRELARLRKQRQRNSTNADIRREEARKHNTNKLKSSWNQSKEVLNYNNLWIGIIDLETFLVINFRSARLQSMRDTYPIFFKSKCQGKVAEDKDDEEMGKCLRCGAIQVISEERRGFTATLTLQPQNGHSITLRGFHNVLKNITEVCGPITLKSQFRKLS